MVAVLTNNTVTMTVVLTRTLRPW